MVKLGKSKFKVPCTKIKTLKVTMLFVSQFKRISVLLQDKISGLFEKMRKGLDMNDKIQRRKDFRNPR